MKKFLTGFFTFVGVVVVGLILISIGSFMGKFNVDHPKIKKPSILELNLQGVIIDGKHFLEDLKKYAKEDNIKGVLIRINSPGGVVGPSQEIYSEIKRVRDELQKPVVVACLSVAASGAYYAAVAADQIVTNPGTLLGSIGVIMEFANLKKLYDWAKIERYSVNTGPYKDSGAEYRNMRPDERALFQRLANQVLSQFKKAVVEGRPKMNPQTIHNYADGRVFTGQEAVELGFADKLGTFEDAKRIVGELSGLGDDPEMFVPPKHRPDFYEVIAGVEESHFKNTLDRLFKIKTMGYPLYLFPGVMER